MNKCLGCKAEIGPTEHRDCPTQRRRLGHHLTHADMAVFVLEAAGGPLRVYDIQRGIEREFGWAPGRPSLNATVALDRRCCWGGRGLYGLWRHGLVPGPRRLVDVTLLVLQAHEKPMSREELAFVLRHLGYRFQRASLYRILAASEAIRLDGWSAGSTNCSLESPDELQKSIGFGIDPFRAVVEFTRRQTHTALQERRRRLESDRGLAENDPIYKEGELGATVIF